MAADWRSVQIGWLLTSRGLAKLPAEIVFVVCSKQSA
jgi:hypothetical protein